MVYKWYIVCVNDGRQCLIQRLPYFFPQKFAGVSSIADDISAIFKGTDEKRMISDVFMFESDSF